MRGSVVSAILVGVVVLASAVEAFAGGGISGWTLSDSATDPFSNYGPPTSDPITLYIWLYCALPQTGGVASAWFELDPISDVISDVQYSSGVVDANPDDHVFDLTLQGCPVGTLLVGQFVAHGSDIFSICPREVGETTGCDTAPQPTVWIGYEAGGATHSCGYDDFFDFCKPATAVTPESWGRIKACYRRLLNGSPN